MALNLLFMTDVELLACRIDYDFAPSEVGRVLRGLRCWSGLRLVESSASVEMPLGGIAEDARP